MLVLFIEFHHLTTIHDRCLVQRSEFDLIRRQRLVGEGPLESVQIMGANGNEYASSAQVLMQLVL